ncbi:type 1 fimbrial protein [Aeromonas dhakensis]|uniref:fimbrial protein n=1 Tax=Aeromonas dhakensis TaxID=196024 RepID=UPI001AFBE3B1|nr:fimbrial protein [Aeromonas dhakensis]QSR45190.1 type 1 fimbrial protein [Aeromonas dhakensis]
MKPHLLLLSLSGLFMASLPALAGSDTLRLIITAEVVSQPCSLRPGDETIQVDFGGVVNKALLRDQRTPSKVFQLHLEECDPAVAGSVKVTFTGLGAAENSSLLALAGDSTAKGIAIGLEQGGQPLPLNQPSRARVLASGTNVLDFGAYVQLLPLGRAGLTPGSFNATANFTLDYD